MDASSSTNPRRMIDDLMEASGSKDPNVFLKPFFKQQIEDHRRLVETLSLALELARSRAHKMKTLYEEMQPYNHQQGYKDCLVMLLNDHLYSLLKVNDLKCWIENAEADIAEKTKLAEGKEVDAGDD
jgi:hypothetical protein